MTWQQVQDEVDKLDSTNNGVLRAREWVRKHRGGKYGVPTPDSVTFEDNTVYAACSDRGWVFSPSGSILFARMSA